MSRFKKAFDNTFSISPIVGFIFDVLILICMLTTGGWAETLLALALIACLIFKFVLNYLVEGRESRCYNNLGK